ncbi:unnamed protein product, partial [Tilletia caries]
KRRGRRKRARGTDGLVENGGIHDDDVGELDEGVAHLDLGSPLSSADLDDEDGEDDSSDGGSGSSLDDSDNDHEQPNGEDAHDGWIGVDGDADTDIETASTSATGHSFVTTYNDSERRRLCALQGQVFERACLLPNSFWKPLYLPTTVFSPVAATAARLLIWGTGPENRGGGPHSHSHSHQGQHGRGGRNSGGNSHANSSLSSMIENTGPPVPARPIWMEGRRHAWMGPQPGQVFWNGPSIVDDCDDGHSSEEEEEDDEVFSRESSPSSSSSSSSSSPSRSGSRVRRGIRSSLDEDDDGEDEEEEGDLTLTSRAIPIPIPGAGGGGGGGLSKGTTSSTASSRRGSGGGGGGGARASQHEQRRAEGQAGGVQTPTRRPSAGAGAGAGAGGRQTPSGQQTPVVGSSSSSTTTAMLA